MTSFQKVPNPEPQYSLPKRELLGNGNGYAVWDPYPQYMLDTELDTGARELEAHENFNMPFEPQGVFVRRIGSVVQFYGELQLGADASGTDYSDTLIITQDLGPGYRPLAWEAGVGFMVGVAACTYTTLPGMLTIGLAGDGMLHVKVRIAPPNEGSWSEEDLVDFRAMWLTEDSFPSPVIL